MGPKAAFALHFSQEMKELTNEFAAGTILLHDLANSCYCGFQRQDATAFDTQCLTIRSNGCCQVFDSVLSERYYIFY